VRLGLAGRNWLALVVAAADEDTQFQFVFETLAGAEARLGIRRAARLSGRTGERLARHADVRRADVVADRHPFVVRQQRIIVRSFCEDHLIMSSG
jgi:hypothetical protein